MEIWGNYKIQNNMIHNINENEEMNSLLLNINLDLEEKKYTKIIKRSAEYIRKYPEEIAFYILISIAYSGKGKFNESLKILKSAEEKFHSHFDMFYQLAKVHEELGNFIEAEEYYHKSIEATPDNISIIKADCWNDLGVLKYNLGFEDEAKECWRRALDINPDDFEANNNLYDTPGKSDIFESLMHNYDLFEKIQIRKYLEKNNIKSFNSKKKKGNILKYIESEWTNNISGKLTTLANLTDAEKEIYFNKIEIDYTKPVPEAGLPVLDDPGFKEFSSKFNFLPENGISYVMSVMPALNHYGTGLERITQIAGGSEITKNEIELFKWAYEMGKIVVKISGSKSEKEFLNLADELSLILTKRITDGNKSEEIFMKILREMTGEE